jgi:hypothetical protein
MEEAILNLARSLLDGDEGISQASFELLTDLMAMGCRPEKANEILSRVDATDGRFYLPEEE